MALAQGTSANALVAAPATGVLGLIAVRAQRPAWAG
jgi:hypothetical protein